MIRKIIGICLYFLGIGLWVILLCTALFWAIPWLVLAYVAGLLSRTGPWPEIRNFALWKWIREEHFRFKVQGNALPSSDCGKVYAIYPHGHYSMTALFFFALNPDFAHARGAIHSAIFYLPVFGSFARWVNAIGVTEDEMRAVLERGESLFMCPGGVNEIARTGHDLTRRPGFIRVAHETGSELIPVWCPQERSYYSHYLPLGKLFEPFFYFPVPMFIWGQWWMPLLPRKPASGESPVLIGKCIATKDRDLQAVERDFWAEMDQLMKNE